ncbi:MAG: transcriptional regulator GcvA [Acidiferrobacterales bacterium]
MERRLPPLNALRAFEAAGRHLSLTKAAEELHVTPAAISHQVKALEDYLGVQLFRRLNRALLLTDAGQACLPGLGEGFDRLAEAVTASRTRDEHRALAVTVPPTFGARWLLSRLDRFRAAHPGIDVRIDATDRLVDFGREEIDIGIRYGTGNYPELHVEPLMAEEVFPVCSPRLLEGPHALRQPDDLKAHTLLHGEWTTRAQPDWSMWLLAAGVHDIDASRGPQFSLAGMAIQAAIEGHGVALAGSVLVADDLAAGRLVKPFDLSVPVSFGYYLVCAKTAVNRPRIIAFREWLIAEARGYEASQKA